MKYRLVCFIFLLIVIASCKKQSSPSVAKEKAPVTNTDTVVYEYLKKPDSLLEAEQYDSAIFYYEKAGERYLRENEKEGYLKSVNQMGWAEVLNGNYSQALEILNKFKIRISKNNPTVDLATYYYNKATAYNYLGSPDSSKFYFRKAIEIYERHFPKFHVNKAECYLGLGGLYCFLLKDYNKAQIYFEKALNELYGLGDNEGYLDVKCRCYYNLAVNNRYRKNYDKAEYYSKGVLEMATKLKSSFYLRYAHNILASIYESRGLSKKSIYHFTETIKYTQLISLEDYKYLTQSLINLGIAYSIDLKYKKAINSFEQALALEEKKNLQLIGTRIEIYTRLGNNYHKVAANERAIKYFKKAERLLNNSPQLNFKGYIVFNKMGDFYFDQNKYNEAIHYYLLALNLLTNKSKVDSFGEQYKDTFTTYELINHLAKAYKLKGQSYNPLDISSIKLALKNFLLADSILQFHRTEDILESDELYLTNNVQQYYSDALNCIHLLYNKGDSNNSLIYDALKLMEQNKAGILTKALRKAKSLENIGVPDSIIQNWRSIKQQIAYWQTEEKSADSTHRPAIQERLLKLIQREELLNFNVEDKYETYLNCKVNSLKLNLDSVQRVVKEDSTLIIIYYVGRENITSLAIGPEKSFLYFTPMDSILSGTINNYKNIISAGNPLDKEEFRKFINSSYNLYERLLKPALDSQATVSKLTIIPDQLLATIPYEALISQMPDTSIIDYKSLHYIFRDFEISYHYSLSLLLNNYPYSISNEKLKLGGWGYLNSKNFNNTFLTNLNFSKRELQGVSKFFESDIFYGEKATETNFKTYANEYDILHLSLHGSLATNSGQACLYFNPDEQNDGMVYPYELYNLSLKAKLAVLSACETGVGNIEPGEGIFSIARGFFYSGCPTLVINLWNVNDKSGAEIQTLFYENLNRGYDIKKSLSQAKLSFIHNSDQYSSHPSFWASPILLGSNNQLVKGGSKTGYRKAFIFSSLIIVLVTFLLACLILLAIRRRNKKFDIVPR